MPDENIPSFNSVAVFNFHGRSMKILIASLALALPLVIQYVNAGAVPRDRKNRLHAIAIDIPRIK